MTTMEIHDGPGIWIKFVVMAQTLIHLSHIVRWEHYQYRIEEQIKSK